MRTIAAGLVIAATALAVAGCGGESDDPTVTPAAERWATDYCTSIASLQSPLEDAAEALQAGQDLGKTTTAAIRNVDSTMNAALTESTSAANP